VLAEERVPNLEVTSLTCRSLCSGMTERAYQRASTPVPPPELPTGARSQQIVPRIAGQRYLKNLGDRGVGTPTPADKLAPAPWQPMVRGDHPRSPAAIAGLRSCWFLLFRGPSRRFTPLNAV
jgi:hypothetical protein